VRAASRTVDPRSQIARDDSLVAAA
jgi:hypothetical protein